MGWTSTHREAGQSDRAYFEAEFPITLREQGEIVASSTVRGVFYAAVRDRADDRVWALVVLVQRGRGWFNFTYKEMDETAGLPRPAGREGCPAGCEARCAGDLRAPAALRER
jgi:hypothetical protein